MIAGIEPVFVAVGSSLVVLFFVIGFCSESVDVREEMRFEVILRMFMRLGLAEWLVANNVSIMKAFFTSVGNLVGLLSQGKTMKLEIAKEQADIIRDLGFGESLLMLILAALLSVIIIICGFFLIYTVYFRFLIAATDWQPVRYHCSARLGGFFYNGRQPDGITHGGHLQQVFLIRDL